MTEAEQIVTIEAGKAWGEMVAAAWWALVEGGMSKKSADEMVHTRFACTVTYEFEDDD